MFLLHDRLYVQHIGYQNRFDGKVVIVDPIYAGAIYPTDTSVPPPDLLFSKLEDITSEGIAQIKEMVDADNKVTIYVSYEDYMSLYFSHVTFLCNAYGVPDQVPYLMATKQLHINYNTTYGTAPTNYRVYDNVTDLFVSDANRISLEMMLFFVRIDACNEQQRALAESKIFSMVDRWIHERYVSTRMYLRKKMYSDAVSYKAFFNQTFDESAMSKVEYMNKVTNSLNRSSFFNCERGEFNASHVNQYCDFIYRYYVDHIKMFTPETFVPYFEYEYEEWNAIKKFLNNEIGFDGIVDYMSKNGSRLFFQDGAKFNMWPVVCLR